MKDDNAFITENPWGRLRQFTRARISLGRAGISLPTREMLAFQLAHAQAQDSVHLPLNVATLAGELENEAQENKGMPGPPLLLHSRARHRLEYLQRPDYGRRLDESSQQVLRKLAAGEGHAVELALVVADGLSSLAVQTHTLPFLRALLPMLQSDAAPWNLAPVCIVEQGRVAVGDEIGELLKADIVVVLIGERPGLSSPDSLGLYLTWGPRTGRTDAERNCISNIRPAGLAYANAAARLQYLLRESRTRRLSGVNLKDRSENDATLVQNTAGNFLLENP